MLAERELSQPLGWDWQEFTRRDVQTGRAAANTPEARLLLAQEEQRRREMQRKAAKKRKKPNL